MSYVYLITQKEDNKTLYNTVYGNRKDAKKAIAVTTHWLRNSYQDFKIYYTENEEEGNEKVIIKIHYSLTGKHGGRQGEIIFVKKFIY